jgi:hypothetical protein
MKKTSSVTSMFDAGQITRYALGFLALTATAVAPGLADTASAQADGALVAGADAVGAPEPAVPAAPNNEKVTPEAGVAELPVSGRDPAWQPPPTPKVTIPSPVDAAQAKQLAEQWGVKLLSLRLSAAGYMMDFRFRVLDANKALPLFDHRNKPYVVVERSNAKLPVPMAAKVGAFRPTNRGKNIKADKNYYMMFANPDRHVKAGEKVKLVIGDFKVKHLTVN